MAVVEQPDKSFVVCVGGFDEHAGILVVVRFDMQFCLRGGNLSNGHFTRVIVVHRFGDEHRGLVAVDAKGDAVVGAVGEWIAGSGS